MLFRPTSGQVVEGIVVDVGWYRTTIRSFEREIFTIPNSVFSRNVVLNITRKQREWRFYEFLGLRLEDLPRVTAVVSDIRKILRADARIIQKLHRRVFLDKLTRDECTVYVSFYVEAANRDAFMAGEQECRAGAAHCGCSGRCGELHEGSGRAQGWGRHPGCVRLPPPPPRLLRQAVPLPAPC